MRYFFGRSPSGRWSEYAAYKDVPTEHLAYSTSGKDVKKAKAKAYKKYSLDKKKYNW
ncbi:hypothetical protein ACEUD0_06465 [Aeromonas veronii]